MTAQPTTVILGSGIIGLSTAFYLSNPTSSTTPSSIYLIDPSHKLFSSASGYAGGFLAKDWFSEASAALGELSFNEHRRLAKECEGWENWGYMRSRGVTYTAGLPKKQDSSRGGDWLRENESRAVAVNEVVGEEAEDVPVWLKRSEADTLESISEADTTAQINPLRLCQFLLKTLISRGVQVHHPSRAISVSHDTHDELSSITILNTYTHSTLSLPCTKVLIAAGAWSPRVFQSLFPNSSFKLPIPSLAGHSLVVRSPKWNIEDEEQDRGKKSCHAVFTTDDAGYSPEIFSRAGGEIYIAGLNSRSLPLPDLATDAQPSSESIDILMQTARKHVSSEEQAVEAVREGICFRPVTRSGLPILGRISDSELGKMSTRGGGMGGVWIAAGHGPWGISLSLGTGKVMAHMIEGRETSVDVGGLGL